MAAASHWISEVLKTTFEYSTGRDCVVFADSLEFGRVFPNWVSSSMDFIVWLGIACVSRRNGF